jgi:hypothetical protein
MVFPGSESYRRQPFIARGLWCNVPKSYGGLLKENAKLRDEVEDLRASAVAWRELYEAAVKRCHEYEQIIRKLGVPIRPPKKRRRKPIH